MKEEYKLPPGEFTVKLAKMFPLVYRAAPKNMKKFKAVDLESGMYTWLDAESEEHAKQAMQWLNYDPRHPSPLRQFRFEN